MVAPALAFVESGPDRSLARPWFRNWISRKAKDRERGDRSPRRERLMELLTCFVHYVINQVNFVGAFIARTWPGLRKKSSRQRESREKREIAAKVVQPRARERERKRSL